MSHYLDFAATSAVRPAEVTQAVTEFLINCGASPGRGGHSLSIESGRIQFRARRAVAKVMGLPGDPGRLAFLFNATHALNTAMFGTVQKGDVIVVSSFDHNAVFRPAFALAETRGAEDPRLRELGISGSAIRLNPDQNQAWRQAQAELRQRFLPKLEEIRRELTDSLMRSCAE